MLQYLAQSMINRANVNGHLHIICVADMGYIIQLDFFMRTLPLIDSSQFQRDKSAV